VKRLLTILDDNLWNKRILGTYYEDLPFCHMIFSVRPRVGNVYFREASETGLLFFYEDDL
jgi:hypothetical protein